ncbi:MAG: hypothetical protein ABTD50_02950 [Polyangiaceae bacterium]
MRSADVCWLVWLVASAGCGRADWAFGPAADAGVQPVGDDSAGSGAPVEAGGDDSSGDGFCDSPACYACDANSDCLWTVRFLLCASSRCVAACDAGACPLGQHCVVPDAGCPDSCEAGICVECAGSQDCADSPDGLACARGRCVECAGPGDCQSGRRTLCDTVRNRCVECLSDANCLVACDVPSGTCITMRDD